jgi:hypothetical protein
MSRRSTKARRAARRRRAGYPVGPAKAARAMRRMLGTVEGFIAALGVKVEPWQVPALKALSKASR